MKLPVGLADGSGRGWRTRPGAREAELVPHARLSGPMPWVIAIMVALTVIAAAAGLALRNAASAAEAELEGGITVQIVEADPAARDRQARAAIDTLRRGAGVVQVRPVPQAEVDRLIEPWLGRGSELAEVPVPALIDARLAGALTAERLQALQRSLHTVAPAARVDAQSAWLDPVFDAIVSLQWMAAALVALLATAMTAAVLLAARNALGAHRETIEVVHLLGGTDAQIARLFQRSVGIDAAAGGAVGLALGMIGVLALGRRFAELGAGLVESGALRWSDWLLIALIPVLGTGLAMLTARLAVLHALRRML